MNILIKELLETEVAFIRRMGSYFEPQDHWGNLKSWAVDNELYSPQQSFIGISLDNPELIESHKCRHDACVTLPEGFEKEKHIDMQFKTLKSGQYALYPFYDTPEKLQHAYEFMYGEWLPNSGFEADCDRDSLEFNMNNPAEDPEGKCKVDLYVPIVMKR